MNDKRDEIRGAVHRILDKKGDRRPFGDDDSLVISGRLESVDVIEIVVFLEDTYSIDFADGFDQQELDSVNAILARVA
jgi:acyl carrier protein